MTINPQANQYVIRGAALQAAATLLGQLHPKADSPEAINHIVDHVEALAVRFEKHLTGNNPRTAQMRR